MTARPAPSSQIPWYFDATHDSIVDANGTDLYHVGAGFCDFGREGSGAANMAYAVHCANAYPALTAEVERLRGVLRDVELAVGSLAAALAPFRKEPQP